MPDGLPWPRVSIVTPSYNQAQFIEETIRSVLLQGYPDLEYIIIDGGSMDGSVEIIRQYEPWLAYWVSEKDRGQSDALNKGFRRATGSIVAWLNSDDWYEPGILPERAAAMRARPQCVLVYSDCQFVDTLGRPIHIWRTAQCSLTSLLLEANQIPQPGSFICASALAAAGGIDETLHHAMDYVLWLRLCLLGDIYYVPGVAANFRQHGFSKSVCDGYKFYEEKLAWLAAWQELDAILDADQRAEMVRRFHVKLALEYLFAEDDAQAQRHLRIALQGQGLPYADLDTLAERLLATSGLSGQTVQDSLKHFERLQDILKTIPKTRKTRQLRHHTASSFYMRRVFLGHSLGHTSKADWLRGVWHDPSWLGNRGVLSIGMETLIGRQKMAGLRRRLAKACTPR